MALGTFNLTSDVRLNVYSLYDIMVVMPYWPLVFGWHIMTTITCAVPFDMSPCYMCLEPLCILVTLLYVCCGVVHACYAMCACAKSSHVHARHIIVWASHVVVCPHLVTIDMSCVTQGCGVARVILYRMFLIRVHNRAANMTPHNATN